MTANPFSFARKTKSLVTLLLAACLFYSGPLPLRAQKGGGDKKVLENKKKKLQNDIKQVDQELKETRQIKNLSMNQLFTIKKKIELREELINTISSEITVLDGQIGENNKSVSTLQQEVDKLKKDYARMIVYAYRNRDSYQRMAYVFAAEDFNQAYTRLKYIQQINDSRRKKAADIASRKNILNEKIQALSQQKSEKQSLLGIEETEKQQLAVEKDDKEKTFVALTSKEKELKEELDEKKKQAAKIDKAIQDLLAAEMARMERERKEREEKARKEKEAIAAKKAKEKKEKAAKPPTGSTGTANAGNTTTDKEPEKTEPVATSPKDENKKSPLGLTPEEQLISDNFAGNKGKLPWPVITGRISLGYGRHPHPVLEKLDVNNNGVDITTGRNALIRSIYEGEVTGISDVPGVGKIVIIRHGEYLSMYVRLEEVYVKLGDKVKTKQNIGKVRFDDEEEKSIVHLEVWKSGTGKLNPEEWIAKTN